MRFTIQTKGHNDFIDITEKAQQAVNDAGVKEGICVLCVIGSTAAITTMEYEPGVMQDIISVLEKIAPAKADWQHHQQWGDENGDAHIKSALIGTDFTAPISDGKLDLGTWQQITLIDFDEKPRTREIVVKVIQDSDNL